MKPNVRILGIDDAPFRFGDAETEAVGVVVRAPSYLEGVMMTHVAGDGRGGSGGGGGGRAAPPRKKTGAPPPAKKPIYVSAAGIGVRELAEAIRLCTVRGAIPEPIRIAHIVATAGKKGESHGRGGG